MNRFIDLLIWVYENAKDELQRLEWCTDIWNYVDTLDNPEGYWHMMKLYGCYPDKLTYRENDHVKFSLPILD